MIQFDIMEKQDVQIKLFGPAGNLIRQFQKANCYVGLNRMEIDGRFLTPGMYLLKAELLGGENKMIKIIKQ